MVAGMDDADVFADVTAATLFSNSKFCKEREYS